MLFSSCLSSVVSTEDKKLKITSNMSVAKHLYPSMKSGISERRVALFGGKHVKLRILHSGQFLDSSRLIDYTFEKGRPRCASPVRSCHKIAFHAMTNQIGPISAYNQVPFFV